MDNTAIFIDHSECYDINEYTFKDWLGNLIRKGFINFLSGG